MTRYDRDVAGLAAGVGEEQLPLIWSKLQAPVPRTRVSRPQLLDVLCGSTRKMTLIRAPAGWGKSTLLADWQGSEREIRPFAWLALDEHDNDPVRFWTYVIESLHTVAPALGESSRVLTQTPGVNLAEVMVPVLINELDATPGDTVFVLDDYHVITDDEIHAGLRLLLHHLPRSLELVVSARSEPPFSLSRLRANGELVEIDAAALSFSAEEADELLNELHGLEIHRDAVTRLCERTEGWAAGLYLAALSLRGRADSSEFVEAFAGDDRSVVDYLSDEVLAAQPDEIQRFLRRTSILERLSASLCDAVTETTLSASMLETIARSNFFLVPLDTKRQWYRYHHLFGEVLKHELEVAEAELVPDLHHRAATWLLDAGFLSEAIHHTIASGDADRASELIVQHWLEFRDRHRLQTILAWLDGLTHEYVRKDPRLCLIRASTLIELGQPEVAELLEAAERGAATRPLSAERAWVEAGVAANRGILHYLHGDVGRIRDTVRSQLGREDDCDPYWESVLFTVLGTALFLSGRSHDALETLDRAARTSEDAGHALARTHSLTWSAVVYADVGDLNRASDALDLVEAVLLDRPDLREYYGTALAHVVRGRLLEHDDRGAEADAAMARGVELAARSASMLQTAYALLEHVQVKHGLGDRDGAMRLLRQARHAVKSCRDPAMLASRAAKLGERGLRTGDTTGTGVESLSERELEVARLVVARKTNREIAAELFVSIKTVETHMRHIFEKLGVSSRVEVARTIERADRPARVAGSGPP